MILGIDASNIRASGGVTHLVELLRAADPPAHGFDRVVVWSGVATLAKIDDRNWLRKGTDPFLDRGLPHRVFWQRFMLSDLAQQAQCDMLFVPGGSDTSGFKPMVTMSQNLLAFERREIQRYGLSLVTLKNLILRFTQARTFRLADGVIFLTQYAKEAIFRATGKVRGKTVIIPHGVDQRFRSVPRLQKEGREFTETSPCQLLYVSHIEQYKHQWHVAEAVSRLKASGLHLHLQFVGPPGNSIARLRKTLLTLDPTGEFIRYQGPVPYEELHKCYVAADINVFASSCENMPNILLEGMASGLPIACSNRGPMPEVLGDAGTYFNPERPEEIARAIRSLIESPGLRMQKAKAAFQRAEQYSWTRCSEETFRFFADVCVSYLAKTNREKPPRTLAAKS